MNARTAVISLGLSALVWASVAGCSKSEGSAAAQPRGPRAVAVRAEPIRRGDLTLRDEHPGELFADAVDVTPRLSGTLLAVPAQLGDRVKKGDLLARIDDAELSHQLAEARAQAAAAEANATRAAAALKLARTELARKEPLAKDQLVSAQEISELESRVATLSAEVAAAKAQTAQARARVGLLEEQRKDTRLVAPFDGVVAERRLDPGATVGPTTPILRLVAAGPPRVRFRVPERGLASLREDAPFQVRTAATGDKAFAGLVKRIGGEVSRQDRSVQVEGVLTEESPILRPGMYATIVLEKKTLQDVLLVPSTALVKRWSGETETYGVFVAKDGVADWRPVEVLGSHGAWTGVEGALTPGEQVLTLGHEELSPGSPIRVVEEGESAPATAAAKDGGGRG